MLNVLRNLDWSVLTDMLLRIIPGVLCITVHESCHGLAAYWLGDDTAKKAGRITLNPLKHVDIFGLVMICVFGFGWAKPVPINVRRMKNQRRDCAITALAGPLSNIILAIAAYVLYGGLFLPLSGSAVGDYVLRTVYLTGYISISLAVFNLIPIPPLDGSKLLGAVLPEKAHMTVLRYERYGMIILMVLLVTNILDKPLSLAAGWCVDWLMNIAAAVFRLVGRVFY